MMVSEQSTFLAFSKCPTSYSMSSITFKYTACINFGIYQMGVCPLGKGMGNTAILVQMLC